MPPPAWDSALGGFVGFGRDSDVVALLPAFADGSRKDTTDDASSVNGQKVDLFGMAGLVGSAVVSGLGKSNDEEGCFSYSHGRLDAGTAQWSVALPAGRATGIPMEDLDSLRGTDSATLAADVKAVAATAPGAQDSIWRDRPFNIEYAGRFKISGATVIVASVMRMLPGAEHYAQTFFIVAERADASAAHTAYGLAYSHPVPRSRIDTDATGLDSEDQVVVDVAVIPASSGRPTLLLQTRGNEVNGYGALGRVSPGRWAVTWSGPHEGGC